MRKPSGKPGFWDLSPEHRELVIDAVILRTRKVGGCVVWSRGCEGDGYGIYTPTGGKAFRVHRAICEYIHGRMPADILATHECDNPPCCSPAHVRPGTHAENQYDKTARGRSGRGEKNCKAKLAEEQVREIRRRLNLGESANSLAVEFDVRPLTIYRIGNGMIWAHLHKESGERLRPPRPNVLDPDKVREIRGLLADGWSRSRVAAKFGVASATIGFVATGRTWSSVT